MQRFFAKNVEEAVEMAIQFKEEGSYDWFRGQLQANWVPASSFERMVQAGGTQELLQQRMARFVAWANTEPSVRYLADPANRDALFAVLQHYGFPTCYIDFSTEPGIAGFFAADCKEPPPSGTQSAIFCLNSRDLRDFYDQHITPHVDAPLEIDLVSVNVDNLWRLQAQAGHFVFANHNWYKFYDLDRIEFPWSGYPAFPPKTHIYPEHSSALEHLLNNYFEGERRAMGFQNFLQEQRERAEAGLPTVHHFIVTADDDEQAATPAVLASWTEEALQPWLATSAEMFHEAVGVTQTITFREGPNAPQADQQLAYGMLTAMRQDKSLRLKAVKWDLVHLPDTVKREQIEKMVRQAWNGMRRLPYADDDIAAACGALLVLCTLPGCRSNEGGKILRAFQTWQADAIEVEFAGTSDSGSRGYCSAADLCQAISPSWIDEESLQSPAIDARAALQRCNRPQHMMEFPKFAALFGRQIIPSQLVRDRSVLHFNPATLAVFGLP